MFLATAPEGCFIAFLWIREQWHAIALMSAPVGNDTKAQHSCGD